MTTTEAYRQMELAERRRDRAKEKGDRAGLAIADGQAAHWAAEFVAAEAAEAARQKNAA
jgi:hypothetical protein